MRVLRLFRGRTRTVLSSATILLLSVALTVAAVISQGYTTTELNLNDGGVWVTKPTGLLVGHLNNAARVLDSGLTTTSNEFDIVQAGNTVLVHNTTKTTLTPIDAANVTLG